MYLADLILNTNFKVYCIQDYKLQCDKRVRTTSFLLAITEPYYLTFAYQEPKLTFKKSLTHSYINQ